MMKAKITKQITYMVEMENDTVETVTLCEYGNRVSISNGNGSMEVNKAFFESFVGILSMFNEDNNSVKQNINLKV